MSAISLKSISGITSITTPSGVNDVFTVHSNDTNERFRVDQHGNVNIVGVVTASSFSGITTEIKVSDESTQTLTFPLFVNASVMGGTVQTANLEPKAGSNLYFNSATGQLNATKFSATTADFTGSGQVDLLVGSTNAGGASITLDGDANGDGVGTDYAYIQHKTTGALEIVNQKNQSIDFLTNNTLRWYIYDSGHFIPHVDSTYDIGSDAIRVRNIYADTLYGDGSNLTGVTQSDRPVGSSSASTTFYEIDNEVTISTDTTLTRASSNAGLMYTKFQEVVVADTKSLIVSAGETLIVDLYQLS